MELEQVVWMLDQRFNFLPPWFKKEHNISRKDITFWGLYHVNTRKELNYKKSIKQTGKLGTRMKKVAQENIYP